VQQENPAFPSIGDRVVQTVKSRQQIRWYGNILQVTPADRSGMTRVEVAFDEAWGVAPDGPWTRNISECMSVRAEQLKVYDAEEELRIWMNALTAFQ
jgi:hypothetical protein